MAGERSSWRAATNSGSCGTIWSRFVRSLARGPGRRAGASTVGPGNPALPLKPQEEGATSLIDYEFRFWKEHGGTELYCGAGTQNQGLTDRRACSDAPRSRQRVMSTKPHTLAIALVFAIERTTATPAKVAVS